MPDDRPTIMGYEDSFRVSVRVAAESLLELIGVPATLEQVFFAATPAPDHEGDSYVEPNTGPASRMALGELPQLAADLYDRHPHRHLVHSHPFVHEQRQAGIRRECLAQAVEQLVDQIDSVAGTPVALPAAPRGNYEVVVCLIVPDRVFHEVPALAPHNWGSLPATTSLLEAAFLELGRAVTSDLTQPDPGPPDVSVSAAEVRDRASQRFFRDSLWRAGTYLELSSQTVSDIASTTYEKATASGHILFARQEHAAIEVSTPFAESVPARQVRRMRKLLETTGPDQALLVADGAVYGLGRCDMEAVNDPDNDVLEVVVSGHSRWQLQRGDTVLMVVDHGTARLPQPMFDEARLRDMASQLLGETANIEGLVALVDAAARLGHGSTLVVTRNAAAEAERLGDQAVRVEPHELTQQHFRDLAHIDGAFILNEELVLHAFGVILDGTADDAPGDPARGSRYNSAVRYVTSRSHDGVLAAVTSDDGGVDLTPDVPHRVPRQLVEDTLIRLEESASDPRRRRDFNNAEEDLRELEVYLNEEQAQRANQAIATEERTRREENIAVVERRPFEVTRPPDDDRFVD